MKVPQVFGLGDCPSDMLTHIGNDVYTIRSAKNNAYYLGTQNNSTTDGTNIVLRTGSVTSGMKWRIEAGNEGYKIVSYSDSTMVLATYSSDSTPGQKLILTEYEDDADYRDEWNISTYTLSLNTYYDQAFDVRYTNASSLIEQFAVQVEDVFLQVLNLKVAFNSPTMITSTPDHCKLEQELTIDASTINRMCPANPSESSPNCEYYNYNLSTHYNNNTDGCENCTAWLQIYRDFIRQYPGTDTVTSVLFTGNMFYNDSGNACNRSYRWYNNGLVMQRIFSNSTLYYNNVLSVLIHEISHDIGAPDHYHEDLKDDDGNTYCRGGDLCKECNPDTGRPEWCIMNNSSRNDIETCNRNSIFCSGCIEDMIEHLNKHHYN